VGSTLAATVAAGLLGLDFLHLVLSRTGMLDVFVTGFGVAAFLCLAYDRGAALGRARRPARWGWGRPWRLAAGLAGGAAAATKWSGWPILAAVIILTVVQEVSIRRAEGPGGVSRAFREEGASIVVALVALPVLVYMLSYAGRLEGTLLAWPWSEGSWIRAFLERQRFMFDFHLGLRGQHPYESPAWSWLMLKRPVLFFFTPTPGGYQEILATGNPLTWWTAILALSYVALSRAAWARQWRWVVLAGFVAGFAPWVLLAGARDQTFLYLILPAVPFMCVALGATAQLLSRSRLGLAVVGAFLAANVALFVFYWPLLTGEPMSYAAWRQRMLFTDCGQEAEERLRPQTEPGPPPAGWCWV
jgi:dolichyl-phosphate-mannose--protein O-mannosyl transferase